ncbi:hypothetical protein EJ05DRAFT_358415 [Pseudovirgaria hyperparasitica]|uniref:Ribosome biogenesis protein SLX9 n=1 Tax=Pseudovirgaria hyperparasitica TaxID=470096 RepID=A0A6A6W6V5_9PEZI|nr:uncharacterized protein EJ05DRAFT_358415 [Pseudovirgaria hyperparasitica]KAF2758592.1 hypothetical protein EJ05DRAFT_358415 [Pseudovirgaria hyperparasitica]
MNSVDLWLKPHDFLKHVSASGAKKFEALSPPFRERQVIQPRRTVITHMAPIRKTAKRASGPSSYPAPTSTFTTTKKDKQAIKHSVLISKIQKSAPNQRVTKRRRPNKKLVATLESLADALPDDGVSPENASKVVGQARVVKSSTGKEKGTTSLKATKGVAKKRAKIEALERQRMSMNMAAMASAHGQAMEEGVVRSTEEKMSGAVQDRWAALRRHVAANMEKKEEFET